MPIVQYILLILLFIFMPVRGFADEAVKIVAFAQDNMANDFRRAQVYEVRDAVAGRPNLTFVHSDARGQTSLLIHQIDRFIHQKVDFLIVGTNDENAVVPVVTRAYQAGIKVVVLDRGIQGQDYTTFINSDNVEIGTLAAKEIARRLNGRGTVLLFEGLPQADVTQLRSKGFLDEIQKHRDIQVIKRIGNYLRKDAVTEMDKLLASGVRVDGIFSESDSMLSGARLALQKHGIDPASLVTIGCDYTSEAQTAIRDGSQTGSVLFPLGGRQSVETIVKLLAGKSVRKHIVIPVELVTGDNVDQVPPIF